MDLDQWHRCKEIFTAARDLPAGERQQYLDEACGGDRELREKVQRLLDAEQEADGLLTAARAAIESKPATRTGARLKDRYVIESEIAEGGLGVVYLAHDELLHGRPVVVKFPTTGYLSTHRRTSWFAAEIEALARINDPGVVGLLDTGYSEDGQPFLVMQYVAGQTLRACLTGEPMPPGRAVPLIRQMARALDAAHSEGVCHLDLKPENIMLLNAGRREERAVIIDFGIARFMQGGVEPGARIKVYAGSPSYMAPEQLTGKGSASSDIYSLGVVALEMLTGIKPEAGESLDERLGRLPAGPLRRARAALARAMHGDLQHRFAAARSFSDALERALPPAAHPSWKGWWKGAAVALYIIGSLGYIWHITNRGPAQLPEPVPFTSLPGEERHPTLDPAGREVFFFYQRSPGDPGGIYSRPTAGGGLRRVTDGRARESQPAVSADGEWIAFHRLIEEEPARAGSPTRGGGPLQSAPRGQVILLPRNGGGEQVAAEGAIDSFALHPSGEWLVTAERREDSQRYQLVARSLWGGEPKTLTEGTPFSSGDRLPVFSADGQRLAYVCASPRVEGDLCVLGVSSRLDADGPPVRVTSLAYPASRPAWTVDDRELVFASGPVGREALWRVEARGGAAPVRLPLSTAGLDAPFISGAARLLIFSRYSADSNIWRLPLAAPDQAGGEPEPMLVSTAGDIEPAISPDNQWIAYVSARSGNPEIWVSARDGSGERRLTRLEASATGGPAWSPDARRILFHSNSTGNVELYTVSLDGEVRRVTRSEARETAGAWSPDGQWIFFTSDHGGRDEVWRIPAAGGEQICVTSNNGGAPRLSPDGRTVYYTVRSGNGYSLWRVDADGGRPEGIGAELSHRSVAVTAEGAYFFARQREDRRHELRYVGISDGSPRTIRRLDRIPDAGLTVAPDGSEIWYSQADQSSSDLYVVQPFE